MFIDFNRKDSIDGEYPIPSVKLENNELNKMKEFIEMAEKQTIVNPAITFNNDVKNEKYDYLSDEAFEKMLKMVKSLSLFWAKEEDGLAPAARQIYLAKQNDQHDKKEYVMREDFSGGMPRMNLYVILERLIAYVSWHMNHDLASQAILHEIKSSMAKLQTDMEDMHSDFDTLDDAQYYSNKLNEAFDKATSAKKTKKKKAENAELIDYKILYEFQKHKVRAITNTLNRMQKEIARLNELLPKCDIVTDVTHDDAYDIPPKPEWSNKDPFLRIMSSENK